jgi:tRNA 2-selenouridine synthase
MEEPRFISVDDFFAEAKKDSIIIDARSPKEFAQGHIPNAINIPLLNNEHRHLVGCCYKEQGQDAAVALGYQLVTPLFPTIQQQALAAAPSKKVYLHCWRGGLRSKITAGLLAEVGITVVMITGGYKAWRNALLTQFSMPRSGCVIAGLTGTGKTDVLQSLRKSQKGVVDLEGMAHHKGSAFGGVRMPEQPTQEQFENVLALALQKIEGIQTPVIVESESRMIGRIRIPDAFFNLMWSWPRIILQRDLESRVQYIEEAYAHCENEELSEKTTQLSKRMGSEQVKDALMHLYSGNRKEWIRLLLHYYDKSYNHHASLIKTPILATLEHPLGATSITAHQIHQQCQTKLS